MKIRISPKRSRIVMFAMPDIAFLLLIFLILTVSVAENEEIEIPLFEYTQETDFPDVVTIVIQRDGTIIIGENVVEDLAARLSTINGGQVIHVRSDREAAYAKVDTVLGALKAAGLRDVVLIAEPDDKL